MIRRLGIVALVGVLAALPAVPVRIPVLFGGRLDSPGVLSLLALCLIFGGVALSYDVLFGYTGLLSFGHALYFAVGVYTMAVAVTRFEVSFAGALGLTLLAGVVVSVVLGAICLRVGGIAFAMVTLAFAQAGFIFAVRDPLRITGGEEGLAMAAGPLPGAFVGVFNTHNVYWLALAYLVAAYLVARWAVGSPAGRVWQAIRENEQRVEVLGLRPYSFKLAAFVLSSLLATGAGVVWVLLIGGANPRVASAVFTLTILVMVVLGGVGTLWGAVLGGALYTYLDHRLVALASSPAVADLPAVLRAPLSEPLFILGTLFVLLVLFFPGGIAGFFVGRRVRELTDLLLSESKEEG